MINRAQHRAASQSFRLLFNKTIQTSKANKVLPLADLIMMDLPGGDETETFNWFEGLPLMRKWVGDRVYKILKAEGFSVKLEPFESSLIVRVQDIMFDKLGGYSVQIRQMAVELKLLKWRELTRLWADGFVGTIYGNCFDGYPLFSASHPTGTNHSTLAISSSALDTAIDNMAAQSDPTNDDPLLISPTHLWHHPALRSKVENLLDSRVVLDSAGMTSVDNKHYKRLIPLEMNGLPSASANHWGLLSMDEGSEQKAAMWRHLPETFTFVAKDDVKEDSVFERLEAKYGTAAFAKVAPAFPQYCWGSDGTT